MLLRIRFSRLLFSAFSLLAVLVLLGFVTSFPGESGESSDISALAARQPTRSEDSEDSKCESYCSSTKPGTSVAEIRWKVSDTPLSEEEMSARRSDQVIEVTVYKDGFETGLYASVSSNARSQRFSKVARTQQRLPGLEELVLADVVTSKDTGRREGFRLATDDPSGKGGEWAVAKVEGLEPGLLYFWRINSKSSRVQTMQSLVNCSAATCPVDSMLRTRGKRPTMKP